MKASDCTFESLRKAACAIPSLGIHLSYYQVEYGLSYAEYLWDTYVEVLDDYRDTFESEEEVFRLFTKELEEFNDIQSSESILK